MHIIPSASQRIVQVAEIMLVYKASASSSVNEGSLKKTWSDASAAICASVECMYMYGRKYSARNRLRARITSVCRIATLQRERFHVPRSRKERLGFFSTLFYFRQRISSSEAGYLIRDFKMLNRSYTRG